MLFLHRGISSAFVRRGGLFFIYLLRPFSGCLLELDTWASHSQVRAADAGIGPTLLIHSEAGPKQNSPEQLSPFSPRLLLFVEPDTAPVPREK